MKIKSFISAALILCFLSLSTQFALAAETIKVVGENARPLDGEGTLEEPYRYLIDEDTKVAWKHFLDIREDGVTEVYEFRDGYTKNGKLIYSYNFRGQDISANVSGPYFLEIRTYDGDDVKDMPDYHEAVYFSFATKRNFPGKTGVTLNVSERFSDGTKLNLTYYGGYDSAVIHGAKPVTAKDEIRQVDSNAVQTARDLSVKNGFVEFDVRYGGNYVLHVNPLDFSSFGVSHVAQYDAEKALGSIKSIFTTESVAKVIAAELGKETEDIITQGDIDSIKSLYLSGLGLKNTQELERVYFSKLESLTLSDNELERIDDFAMPNLTFLDASNNRLESANALTGLKALEHINLSDNYLEEIPDISMLANLQTVNLSDNHLKEIPKLKSQTLRYLDLSNNRIAKTTASLEECPNIETILLDGQITDLSTQSNYKMIFAAFIALILLASVMVLAQSAKKAKNKAGGSLL